MMTQKECRKCNISKDINEFPKNRHQCKECYRKYRNLYNLKVGRTKNKDGTKLKHNCKYDLTNKKFGRLTVIKFVGLMNNPSQKNTRASFFECVCDCGTIKNIAGIYLKNGNVKSCGCLNSGIKKDNAANWSGYEGISGTTWNRIVRNAGDCRRYGKWKHGKPFEITKEYCWELFKKQNGKCALSGLDIILDVGSKLKNQTASLDRIDSSKGYIEGNVQWVHRDVNSMKMDFDEKYFVDMCKKIVENRCG